MKKLLLVVFVGVVLIASGCDGDNDPNGPVTDYSSKDLEGTWLGIITIDDDDGTREVMSGFVFDSLGNFINMLGPDSVISTSGTLTVTKEGNISGTLLSVHVNDYSNEETSTIVCQGSFSSNTVMQFGGAWTYSDDAGGQGSGTLSCEMDKEDFEYVTVSLNRWEQSAETWWLNIKAYAKGATRVYMTGTNVVGEYDLYKCGTFGYLDYWWSSNNPNCDVGDNNYSFHYVPDLPFVVEIHVVTSTGERRHSVTISDYNLIPQEGSR
ncbi:MAG: hypothetical protein KAU35_02960 [candidate division Zixibacteria bacterium]|nr:hypothetical protein [candidate division Zixibacteria bacterium]